MLKLKKNSVRMRMVIMPMLIQLMIQQLKMVVKLKMSKEQKTKMARRISQVPILMNKGQKMRNRLKKSPTKKRRRKNLMKYWPTSTKRKL